MLSRRGNAVPIMRQSQEGEGCMEAFLVSGWLDVVDQLNECVYIDACEVGRVHPQHRAFDVERLVPARLEYRAEFRITIGIHA